MQRLWDGGTLQLEEAVLEPGTALLPPSLSQWGQGDLSDAFVGDFSTLMTC